MVDFASGLISAISIFGLILNMIGTSFLVKPFILTNSAIQNIGKYKTKGAMLGEGEKVEYNQDIIKTFQESRDEGFRGISYIFTGFSLQLPQYLPKMEWYNNLIILIFIFIADYIILGKMKNRNKVLKRN